MLKKTVLAVTLMLSVIAAGPTRLYAQKAESPKAADEVKIASAYRLDFSLNEMDDGKKVNTRQYSMHSRSGDWNEIRIGTRVPVESKQGEFQYLDVGMTIRCRLTDQSDMASLGENVSLKVSAELTNFAVPEQQQQTMHPAIRQMRMEASTVAVLGKSMVVGVVDDPNSKHQYQLEVTVTKLK
ncbi:MAG TPA: hypothetical protein VNS62_01685 [Candidatus Udaeobacter sp.]|nr:hypothetical protein [Candidatus Udaeobacter sp.]